MVSRLHLSVFIGIAAALWATLLLIDGVTVTAHWFRPFSSVVGTMVVLLLGFEKWGWRWKVLHPWFVSQPNIQGTWKGELTSLWTDPATRKGRDPIEVYLVIKQTLSSIRVRLITKESQSDCLVASMQVRRIRWLERILIRQKSPSEREARFTMEAWFSVSQILAMACSMGSIGLTVGQKAG